MHAAAPPPQYALAARSGVSGAPAISVFAADAAQGHLLDERLPAPAAAAPPTGAFAALAAAPVRTAPGQTPFHELAAVAAPPAPVPASESGDYGISPRRLSLTAGALQAQYAHVQPAHRSVEESVAARARPSAFQSPRSAAAAEAAGIGLCPLVSCLI
jgi:hypothetical protein